VALGAVIRYFASGVRTYLNFIGTKKEKECRYRKIEKFYVFSKNL
jgi:hypothetical protein